MWFLHLADLTCIIITRIITSVLILMNIRRCLNAAVMLGQRGPTLHLHRVNVFDGEVWLWLIHSACYLPKHNTLTQCRFTVGPWWANIKTNSDRRFMFATITWHANHFDIRRCVWLVVKMWSYDGDTIRRNIMPLMNFTVCGDITAACAPCGAHTYHGNKMKWIGL